MIARRIGLLAALGLGLILAGPAQGAELGELEKMVLELRQVVRQQGQEIERLKGIIEKQRAQVRPVSPATTRPAQDQAKTKAKTKSAPDRFKFATDLRLRWENFSGRKVGEDSRPDRDRFRIRWRLFGDARLTEELSLHGMLTTSSGNWFDEGGRNWQPGRTSNVTMGEEMNNKNIYIGRIYATYHPQWAPGLEIGAGKFKNTFQHTDIMWDPDLNPEGAYQRYQYDGFKIIKPFVHLGQMVVAENNRDSDAFLLLWQAGAEAHLSQRFKWTLAFSYYDWRRLSKSDMSKVEGNAAGNTVDENDQYIYDYRLAQGLTFLDFPVGPVPIHLWFDYIVNVAEGVPSGKDRAWSTGFMAGRAKKQGDLALYFKYARIEPDAVVGAMADGDFYGSNRKGYKAQLRYQILDPLQFRLSWFQTDSLEGPQNKENRLQTDLIFRFAW